METMSGRQIIFGDKLFEESHTPIDPGNPFAPLRFGDGCGMPSSGPGRVLAAYGILNDRMLTSVLYAENDPDPNLLTKWGVGVIGALLLVGYGVGCFLRRIEGIPIRGKGGATAVTLLGWDAVLLGVCVILGALCMHFHFFWSQTVRLRPYYESVRIVAVILTTLIFCVLAFRIFRLGFGF